MVSPAPHHRFTFPEYCALVEDKGMKLEFLDGQVWAMSGGTPCGELQLDPEDPKRHTALNPHVIVEVLSPSTEEYDRGAKLEHYRTIPSLHEVVLVAHDKREVEIVRREDDGAWSKHVITGDGVAECASLGVTLALPDVYRDPLA